MYEQINPLVQKIKAQRPLIINITNQVTMNFVANGLLSLGASPFMAQAVEEIEDALKIAHAVVINIGTLSHDFIHLCEQVCIAAHRLGKPVVFDPVGAGASHYRTQTCLDFLERFQIAIIRGNASEIMALAGSDYNTKGVDTSVATCSAIESAQYLASRHARVVIISGETDAVIDSNNHQLLQRGSSLMPMVTGCGCLLTAVIAAFHAVHENPYEAASAAVEFYTVCGEIAAEKSSGPGSFAANFLDTLSLLPERKHYEKIQ